MDDHAKQEVLVRTHGGYPRARILWEVEGRVALVVEPARLSEVEAGDRTWIVGIPLDDVFEMEAGLAVDQQRPYEGWGNLRAYRV